MQKITNKNLSIALEGKLGTVKRWATYFCDHDADPEGGQHSFKTREYTNNEALKIGLGGQLIGLMRFRIKEAERVMSDISEWLSDNGLDFSDVLKRKSELVVTIILIESGYCYEVREILKSSYWPRSLFEAITSGIETEFDGFKPKHKTHKEIFSIHRFGAWMDDPEFAVKVARANRREFRLTRALDFLAERMGIVS